MSDPKAIPDVAERDDTIGQPTQCPDCFAWVLPGATHSCQPQPNLRPLFLALVGARVKQRREALGLQQADLATALGLSRASVANLEAGNQDIPVSRLYALAAALRCTPQEIV